MLASVLSLTPRRLTSKFRTQTNSSRFLFLTSLHNMKLFIIGLVSLVSVLHFFHNSTPTSTPIQYPHTTVKILDGDTFVLNGEHIRLIGLNAPEIYHEWKGKADCGAYQSMSQLEKMLTQMPASMIRLDRKGTDKYWRTLAIVFIWDKDTSLVSVNESLVLKGYAQPFAPKDWTPAPDYTEQYNKAMDANVGNYYCPYYNL